VTRLNVETPRWGVLNDATSGDDTPRYKGHRIESARLKDFDYRTNAAYFVTICTRNREHTLGRVEDDQVILSLAGQIVDEEWRRTADVRQEVALDAYIVMPNHVHGIIVVQRGDSFEGIAAPEKTPQRGVSTLASGSLGAIVNQFKGACTKRIRGIDIDFGWQPRFWDHVIRGDESLDRIREYIAGNPLKWETEQDTPENIWM
jgi:REP element-mobilizing transposase RayT